MNRRKFFGAMAAAPAAAKMAAETAAAELSKIHVGALGGAEMPSAAYGQQIMGASGSSGLDPRNLLKRALMDPQKRAELRSLMFERNRHVPSIDPDIACYRSFSLNAKVTFQRQRNVERGFQEDLGESGWQRWQEAARKLIGWP
jgi:hypothetical protein